MHSSWNSRGGGSLGFLANSFEGGIWGCEKISGGVLFLHLYVEVFKNLYRGYMRCPPPPLCASMTRYFNFSIFLANSDFRDRNTVRFSKSPPPPTFPIRLPGTVLFESSGDSDPERSSDDDRRRFGKVFESSGDSDPERSSADIRRFKQCRVQHVEPLPPPTFELGSSCLVVARPAWHSAGLGSFSKVFVELS
jgi:hypothetical protein